MWERSNPNRIRKSQITTNCCFLLTLKLWSPVMLGKCLKNRLEPQTESWNDAWLIKVWERRLKNSRELQLLQLQSWRSFKLLVSLEWCGGKMHSGKAACCQDASDALNRSRTVSALSIDPPLAREAAIISAFRVGKKVAAVRGELLRTEMDFQSWNRFLQHNGPVCISQFFHDRFPPWMPASLLAFVHVGYWAVREGKQEFWCINKWAVCYRLRSVSGKRVFMNPSLRSHTGSGSSHLQGGRNKQWGWQGWRWNGNVIKTI